MMSITDDRKCEECGCIYFHEPDRVGLKECCFPYFDFDEEDFFYKKQVCWAEKESENL